jgi:hypothetical protein
VEIPGLLIAPLMSNCGFRYDLALAGGDVDLEEAGGVCTQTGCNPDRFVIRRKSANAFHVFEGFICAPLDQIAPRATCLPAMA